MGRRLLTRRHQLDRLLVNPGVHRRDRLADQLERPDHAVRADPVPRGQGPRAAAARAGDAPQAPGSPGHADRRHRLAGDRPGSCRQDGQHRRGQGDRQARHPRGVLPTARTGEDRRPHRRRLRGRASRAHRQRDAPRTPGPLARPSALGQASLDRSGAGAVAVRRRQCHRSDRRTHRPIARPQDQ